jgi:hypothetical protein
MIEYLGRNPKPGRGKLLLTDICQVNAHFRILVNPNIIGRQWKDS